MKNVIVTGANGFIGSSLIKKFISNQIKVVAIDLSFSNYRLPDSELITKIECSLQSENEIIKVIPTIEYDCFYHFAWAGVNGPSKADPIVQLRNAETTLICAKVANTLHIKKFLCAGTIAERAVESLSNLKKTSGGMMYGVAKNATHSVLESYCKNVGLNFVWMQFSNIYGPQNKTGNLVSYTLSQLMNDNEATFGPALQPYDFIFVDDLLEAVYRLGDRSTNEISYFIGSGAPQVLKDYLLEIGKICDKEELIKIGVRSDDGIKYSYDMFDTSLLVRDIGNYVSVSFKEGIEETLRGY